MAALPPLSVITPVHNGANWIAETIASVAAQAGHGGVEHIVLDDGSTDETSAIVAARAHPGLRLLRHAQMGESRTVNRGIAEATHDLVAVVNADDPVLPGWARTMVGRMQTAPDLVAAYPDWLTIDAEGNTRRKVLTAEWDLGLAFGWHFCIPGPGAVLRRSTLPTDEPVRDPRRRSSADFDFWLRLGLRGRIARVPEVLATWRRHNDGTSAAGRGPAMAQDRIDLVHAMLARPDLPSALRALGPQALSAVYNNAAMLGLRAAHIPALRYALLSYWHKPIWVPGTPRPLRRSPPHLAYAALQPVSRWLHRGASPLLPRRFGYAAMMDGDFGVADA